MKRPNHRCTPEEYTARKIAMIRARLKVVESGCHEWQGFIHPITRYGATSYKGKTRIVHRLLWQLVNGPIPPKMDVCHTCDNRRCCNLEHLWLGTRQQNLQDAARKGRAPGQDKTHCNYGHEFTPENTTRYGKNGWRHCKKCQRIRQRMKAGWTREEAEQMDLIPSGYTRHTVSKAEAA